MFGFHPQDLIVVLVIALLIFGPKKLPEMGSAIGKSIKEFRKGVNEISNPDAAAPRKSNLSVPKDIIDGSASSHIENVEPVAFATEGVHTETVAE